MNRKRIYLILTPVILAVVYCLGPTVNTVYSVEKIDIPNDVEKYLEDSENRFADIKSGTEKKLVWANPGDPATTPYSIVYLHGFSASRQEVAPLCDELANSLNVNLYYTRLTGHGRAPDAMGSITVNALINDATESLEIGKRIGHKVILIGSSTGATLATWLAAQAQSENISAVILLSPNFGLKRQESELMLYPWGNVLLQIIEGKDYKFTPVNALQEKYWTTRYPVRALMAMMGLIDVTRKAHLSNITYPTLVIYSEQDQIINIEKVKYYFNSFSSPMKKLVSMNHSSDPQQHILAGNVLSPSTTGEVLNIIKAFLSPIVPQ